jgi:hypothetical protein
MAEISGDSGGHGSGSGGDIRLREDVDEAERPSIDDQPTAGASSSTGAVVSSSEGGGDGRAEEAGGDEQRRAPVDLGRTPVLSGAGGLRVQRLDYQSGVEAVVVTGGRLGEVGGSSSSGGVDRTGQPSRDPASGKAPIVEEAEDTPRPDHTERVEFTPPAGVSSSREPITSSDLAEFVGEAALARLLRDNPAAVAAVIEAREARLQEIARWDEEQRLIREAEEAARAQEELVRETEEAERAQEEGPGAYEVAVTWAEARRGEARAPFVAETYVPPEPHVFVPSGADSYVPRQSDYDAELVLRDPEYHLSRTWTQVYLENLPPFQLLNLYHVAYNACNLGLENECSTVNSALITCID